MLVHFLVLFSVLGIHHTVPVTAAEEGIVDAEPQPVSREVMRLVTIFDKDEHGENLRFPMNVTADDDAKETYVVNGGQSNVIVYGRDFFESILEVFLLRCGRRYLYLCSSCREA